MPTVSVAKVSRKFNLGNYESMEVGLECFVGEGENIYDVLGGLEAAIKTYMQTAHPEALNVSKQQQVQLQSTKMVQLSLEEQLEKIKAPFGELASLLTFTIKEGKVVATPRQFLGENFGKIASVVRELGGRYLSEGKNSRFELPLSK